MVAKIPGIETVTVRRPVEKLRIGVGPTLRPEFCANVPRIKSEFFGLMQYSSTLIVLSVKTLLRARKLETLAGISTPDGETVDFNQTHGGAVDFGARRVQYQTLALQEAEATIEPVHAGTGADYCNGDAVAP
jgi:hypothetical protein